MTIAMSSGDMLVSLIIGMVTGVLGGLLSGYLVTYAFRKKDAEKQKIDDFHKALRRMYYYLYDIKSKILLFEGDLLKEKVNNALIRKSEMNRYERELTIYNEQLSREYSTFLSYAELIVTNEQEIDADEKAELVLEVRNLSNNLEEYIKSIDPDIL